MTSNDDEGSGEAWSDILARRSPEGRAVVEELIRAEQTALAVQERIMAAMSERRECDQDVEAFQAALAEVDRLREKVYCMAHQ